MSIFESLVIYLMRRFPVVKVTTGLCYGHKIISLNNIHFTEIDGDNVSVACDNVFNITFNNTEELLEFCKHLSLYNKNEQVEK